MNILMITIIFMSFQQIVSAQTSFLKKIFNVNQTLDLRPLKKSLGYIEDTYLNFTELTNKYGYPTETHTVTTEDGYILTVFRIPSRCSEVKRYPILLMHGISDSADGWILTGPKEAIGYILSDNCYDVWALNQRGTFYSRKHIRLDPDRDPQFWDFSFEEPGLYDIPAVIDYVLLTTTKKKLIYIGHSQGSTEFFVLGSMRPEYNDKVQLAIQVAPVACMAHTRGLLYIMATRFYKFLRRILDKNGIKELAARHQYFPNEILQFLCQVAPLEVCGTIYHLGVGAHYGVILPKTLSVIFGHLPAGVSVKSIYHYAQLIRSKKFQRFDSGTVKNLKVYGTVKPPQYNITLISSPVSLISAQNDFLVNLKDVSVLRSKLPNLIDTYIIPNPIWSHNDLLWGKNATELLFNKILDYLQEYSNR